MLIWILLQDRKKSGWFSIWSINSKGFLERSRRPGLRKGQRVFEKSHNEI